MTQPYGLTDNARSLALAKVEQWLQRATPWQIAIDRVTGRGASRKQTQIGALDADMLDLLVTPDAILDEVLQAHASLGGTLQVRCIYRNEEGEPDYEHQLRHSFTLTRGASPSGAQGAAGRSGADDAASTLSRGAADILAMLGRRVDGLSERLETSTEGNALRTIAQMEQRIADAAAYQGEISRLRTENAVLKIEARLAEQQQPDSIIDRLPPEALIAIIGEVAPLLGEVATAGARWLKAKAVGAEAAAGLLDGDDGDDDPDEPDEPDDAAQPDAA